MRNINTIQKPAVLITCYLGIIGLTQAEFKGIIDSFRILVI